LLRLQNGDMTANAATEHRTKDGRVITCQWLNTPLMSAEGRFTGLLCLAEDGTDRIAAGGTLRMRDRAIQAVNRGVLLADPGQPDTPIVYASPGFERLTGYSAAEVIGRNCRFLQGPHTDRDAVAQVREAIREGRPVSVELLNYRNDGTPFWNGLSV